MTQFFTFILQILLGNNINLDLGKAIHDASSLQPISVSEKAKTSVHEFMTRRLEQLLVDSGIAVEVARAVLNERANNPLLARRSADELQARQTVQTSLEIAFK